MSQFGQFMDLFNILNQIKYTAMETAIAARKIAGETDIAKRQEALQAEIAADDLKRQQMLQQAAAVSASQLNANVSQIALFGGLGLTIFIILLMVVGTKLKRLRDEKYEYVIEEIKP